MPQRPSKKLVSRCPFCEGRLEISRMCCQQCDTSIETKLPIPAMLQLPADLQEFVMIFLRCEGKIRDVEKELGISYPTVIKRLNLVNILLGNAPLPRTGDAEAPAAGPEAKDTVPAADDAAASVAASASAPAADPRRVSRKDVLDQLDRGEITFQQATQLLRST